MRFGLKKGLLRAKQQLNKQYVHMTYFPLVKIVQGEASHLKIAKAVFEEGIEKVLVVTGEKIEAKGLLSGLLQTLAEYEIEYSVYSDVNGKPTVENVEGAHLVYMQNDCKGFIAVGGGSVIDCCKVAALKVKNPYTVRQLAKMNSVSKESKLNYAPPIFVVPTTAGSGSEVTPKAVITDTAAGEKVVVFTNKFMPRWVALDPELHTFVSNETTANSGIVALSHAVESYIGVQSTAKSKKYAELAVKDIFEYLPSCYNTPDNLKARLGMSKAAMNAALSARIGGEGYAYALGNCADNLYNLPYGYVNAIALPWVLEYCFDSIYQKLAELAVLSGVIEEVSNREEVARGFIEKIKELNTKLFIPKKLSQMDSNDIPLLAKKTLRIANDFCPVTCLLDKRECEQLLTNLLPGGDSALAAVHTQKE